MKKWLLLGTLFLMLTGMVTSTAQGIPRETKEQQLEAVLLTTLDEPICQAVQAHHKNTPPKYSLSDSQIVQIRRNAEAGTSFTVQVVLRTFNEAHEPSTIDTIMLRIESGKTSVISYTSQPDKEWKNQT